MSRDILELGSSLGYLDELYELQQSEPGAVDPSWNAVMGPVATPTTVTKSANGTPKANGQVAKAPTELIAGPALPGRAAPPYGGAESIDEPQNGMAVQTPH